MADLTVDVVRILDEFRPQRDGQTITHMKVVTFYIGKYGPFTERVSPENWSAELAPRVAALKAGILALPT